MVFSNSSNLLCVYATPGAGVKSGFDDFSPRSGHVSFPTAMQKLAEANLFSLGHDHSAIHGQHLPRDVTCPGASQE
jgi:hypothetical protein